MDSTHATQPALPGEHLKATPELRWCVDYNRERYPPRVLQQKWISSDAARFDWRDVPEVEVR